MPWCRRGNGRYFYQSVRVGRRVTRVYLGRGEEAERAAAAIARRRADRGARRAEEARCRAVLAILDDYCRLSEALMRTVLYGAGYHLHQRGEWRRRRYETNQ